MVTVTITGNAWTHQGEPIPAEKRPELFLRPKAHAFGSGSLLLGVEAKADLNLATGAFTVDVESVPGVFYEPVMRWLINPHENDPKMWAYGYAEWPFLVSPNNGGVITDLINKFPPGTILVALGPPTVTGVAWIDLLDQTDEGALVYAPRGRF